MSNLVSGVRCIYGMRLYKACASHMDLVYCTVFSYLNYYYPYTVYKCHSFIFPLPLGTDTGTLFCLGHFILPERCAIPVMCTCKIVPILVLLYSTVEMDIVLLLKYFHWKSSFLIEIRKYKICWKYDTLDRKIVEIVSKIRRFRQII